MQRYHVPILWSYLFDIYYFVTLTHNHLHIYCLVSLGYIALTRELNEPKIETDIAYEMPHFNYING